jgi:hypothetical protein
MAGACAFVAALACNGEDGDGPGAGGSGAAPPTGGQGGTGATAGASGSGGGSGAGGSALDPFTGDCTTSRWGNVSEACWSCMCAACADTLNACGDDCVEALVCGFDAGCMVDRGAEILCEIRCVGGACLTTPEAQAAAQSLVDLDTCLIGAQKPSGFRICEDVCAIPYPGDVCERYP